MTGERKVQYGIRAKRNRSALFLACGTEDYHQSVRRTPVLGRVMTDLQEENVVKIVQDDQATIIGYDLARIGRRRLPEKRQADLLGVVVTAATVGNRFMLETDDPEDKLAAAIMLGRDGSGRIGLSIRGRWPEPESDRVLSLRATAVMRVVAHDLRYGRSSFTDLNSWYDFINSDVHAKIERARGVTLQTNEMGACSIDTSGASYRPSRPTFRMDSENFYGHDQLLIGLAGAIAMLEPGHLET